MDPDRPILLTLDEQLELLNLRIDRLCHFLEIAVHHARRDPTSAWWKQHVVWALRRLEQLGYPFPEVSIAPLHLGQDRESHRARLSIRTAA